VESKRIISFGVTFILQFGMYEGWNVGGNDLFTTDTK